MGGKGKEKPGKGTLWRYLRPSLAAGTVVLAAFFVLQGIPLARTLYRRTDLVSVLVVQDGRQVLFTDKDDIAYAAQVPGMLARRFPAKAAGEPDTLYVFTFEDGSELEIGVLGNAVYYDGKWYSGAASTPDLFRQLTAGRYFGERDRKGEKG